MSQSSNIVDISNVGLKTFWNLKSHMQDASQLATAHYPETLDRIFVSPASVMTHMTLGTNFVTSVDYRSTIVLPDSLVLDQALVRPHHRF